MSENTQHTSHSEDMIILHEPRTKISLMNETIFLSFHLSQWGPKLNPLSTFAEYS